MSTAEPTLVVAQRPKIVALISHVQTVAPPSGMAREMLAVIGEFAPEADVQVIDVALAEAVQTAKSIVTSGNADVLVSMGATGAYLKKNLDAPVVLIRTAATDVGRALIEAATIGRKVAFLNYREINRNLAAMSHLFQFEIRQSAYHSLDEAMSQVRVLKKDGFNAVVGSSMVTEIAEQAGWSVSWQRRRMLAVKRWWKRWRFAAARAPNSARRQRLDAVLQHIREGVMAIDANGIVLSINPTMAHLLDVTPQGAIDRPIGQIAPSVDVRNVLRAGIAGENLVIKLGKRTVVANLMPIHEDGVQTGAVLTCQDMSSVQTADRRIRTTTRPTAFTAKYHLAQIVGESPAVKELLLLATGYAGTDSTVLITGESGTGKELIAQGIHNSSARRRRPFVPVNCASFPETLLESELFGHEEGAFSGSRRGGKAGLFEAAHTGTIFLDEIGDMPISSQTRLLRVLQEREVMRLGGAEPTTIDVRVIAATNVDLRERVSAGAFREDLYYRLNILRLALPPLRDRVADIPLIAQRLLEQVALRSGLSFDGDAILATMLPHLVAYDWPGNIRELENVMERAAVSFSGLCGREQIHIRNLQAIVPELFDAEVKSASQSLRASARAAEIIHVRKVVDECSGDLDAAAHRLGCSRTTLWRRLRSPRPAAVKRPRSGSGD
jgi:propionate catabolism operon transcriptional regulator